MLSQFVTVDALFVDNISKFVEDLGSCGDEGGVSTLRDGGVLCGLTPDPLPVLSCCAAAFLALSRRVLLCVFGLFLAVGVAFQLPGWEGRRVRFLFLFPLMGTDLSTGVSVVPAEET